MDGEGPQDLRRDGVAKALLSDPRCLARIVKDAVDEAEGMSVDEVSGRLGATQGGRALRMLPEELFTDYGSVAYDLVFEFEAPEGKKMAINVEIQAGNQSWIREHQMMCLGGLAWYANRKPAKDYSTVRPVYCFWVFLNPKADDRNRLYKMSLRRNESKVPMRLAEFHIGDPETAGSDRMRLLDLLFRKDGGPKKNLESVATAFDIDWTNEEKGKIMISMDEFVAEYKQGLIDGAKEDGMIQGHRIMVLNYAETVRRIVSAGMSREIAMSFVPEDIAGEVSKELDEQIQKNERKPPRVRTAAS
ncbi:MAG: hypothetical protein J5674_02385 [Candidatus Methanomethylophilaceae archaeon]|nr:hypothetical protein [Candidatus Methanomethylophilaceae archaeon]